MSRRSRRSKIKAGSFKIGSILGKVAPYIAFAQQITEKDMAILPANRSYTQQLKDLMNIVTGRMSGFHVWKSSQDYKPPFTINPSAILGSKWVQAGAGMIAYSLIAKKVKFLPKGGTLGSIGKKIILGGGLGALFDAPTGNNNAQVSSYTAPMAVGSESMMYSNYSYSSPSTSGGMY